MNSHFEIGYHKTANVDEMSIIFPSLEVGIAISSLEPTVISSGTTMMCSLRRSKSQEEFWSFATMVSPVSHIAEIFAAFVCLIAIVRYHSEQRISQRYSFLLHRSRIISSTNTPARRPLCLDSALTATGYFARSPNKGFRLISCTAIMK